MNQSQSYIDIHTHILPGVDDGPKSLEETINILNLAHHQHIETIIATPHYAVGSKNLPVNQLELIRDQVQSEATKINKHMKILLGNELFYSDSIIDRLKSKQALPLADSKYVLVEFAYCENYNSIYRGLSNLINAGYLPVLAHIERYNCLNKKEDLIIDLIDLGCYMQMNCNSLLGGIFQLKARYHRKLVGQGLVHFIGSDCHDDRIRVPNIGKAADILYKRCDTDRINQIFYINTARILENSYID